MNFSSNTIHQVYLRLPITDYSSQLIPLRNKIDGLYADMTVTFPLKIHEYEVL
jgi:hypothetical protein